MIEISFYREEDRPGLEELYRHWDRDRDFDRTLFRETLDEISRDGGALLVARRDGACVGYAHLARVVHLGLEPYWEVMQLLVSDECRGEGIGSALMGEAERVIRERGGRVVKLSSQLHRSRAHVFYEERGYTLYKLSKFYQKRLD